MKALSGAFCVFLVSAAFLQAASVQWDGEGDGSSWNDALNWDTNAVPGPEDDVTIDAESEITILLVGTVRVHSLTNHETLRVYSRTGNGTARLECVEDLVNTGVLILESSYFTIPTEVVIENGALINETGAQIRVVRNAGNTRLIWGSITNRGEIQVENGINLEMQGDGQAFLMEDGSCPGPGGMLMRGGSVTYSGGDIGQSFFVHSTQIHVTENVTAPGRIRARASCSLVDLASESVEVWVEGTNGSGAGNAVLTTLEGATNAGTIRMQSTYFTLSSRLSTGNSTLLNLPTGTIVSRNGEGNSRSITGHIINQGLIDAPDIYTTFSGVYESAGGTVAGQLYFSNTDVYSTVSPPVSNRMYLVGGGNRFLTDVLPNLILHVLAKTGGDSGNALLTFPEGVSNHGHIIIDSAYFTVGSEVRVESGAMVNEEDGRIEVRKNQGNYRRINGNLVNHGQITVESGITLDQIGTEQEFHLAGGTLESSGAYIVHDGRFWFSGGEILGNAYAYHSEIQVDQTVVSDSRIRARGYCTLVHNLAPTVTVWVEGNNAGGTGHALLTTLEGAINAGTILLQNTYFTLWSRLAIGGASLINTPTGVIRSGRGEGNDRRIDGRLINQGLVEAVDITTWFSGAYETAGGRVDGPIYFTNTEVSASSSPAESTTLNLVGSGNRMVTDNLEKIVLQVPGWNAGGTGNAMLTVDPGLSNHGMIRLTSWYFTVGSELIVPEGRLTNGETGILESIRGEGNYRRMTGEILNQGTVRIRYATNVGRSGAEMINEGTYLVLDNAEAEILGASFSNEPGGTLAGQGVLDLSRLQVVSSGIFAPGSSPGSLTLRGAIWQDGQMDAEIGGVEAGTQYDRLSINGSAWMGGLLRVSLIDDFVPEEGQSFRVLAADSLLRPFDGFEGLEINEELGFDPVYAPNGLTLVVRPLSDLNDLPPTIASSPQSLTVVRGRSAAFHVLANGTYPLEYQWFFQDEELPGETSSSLTIASVQESDAGEYKVRVSNASGEVFSAPAVLTYKPAVGQLIPTDQASLGQLPSVEGNGVLVEIFNGVGGGSTPTPETLEGHAPNGLMKSPRIDFPHPGDTVGVGTSFNNFFADTATPPAAVSELQAANFSLRSRFYLRVEASMDRHTDTPEIDIDLGVGSDDGFYLEAGGLALSSNGPRGFSYTWVTASFPEEGLYPVTLNFGANASGSSGLAFSWRTAAGEEIVPQSALYLSSSVGDVLITFEEYPAGTYLADQYADLGVYFETVGGDPQITDVRPDRFVPVSIDRVFGDPALPVLEPVVVELSFYDPVTGVVGETDFVSFFLIDTDGIGAEVTVLDAGGQLIEQRTVQAGAGTQELVEIEAEAIHTVRLNLGSGEETAALDNLTFRTPSGLFAPPELQPVDDATVAEGSLLEIQLAATDDDTPVDQLRFSLMAGAPSGAAVDPVSGLFTWTPLETQGPGVYPMTVVVEDDTNPPLADSQVFTVTVEEVNRPPILTGVPIQYAIPGAMLSIQLSGYDPDLPAQALTYALGPDAPSGAQIDPASGLLDWMVPPDSPSGPVLFEVQVFDDFDPPAMASTTIHVEIEQEGPKVLSVEPQGIINRAFSQIDLAFSEPLLPASVHPGTIRLDGPAGPIPFTEMNLVGGGTGLQLRFMAQDVIGTYVLTVDTGVMDLAGNPLDGDADGVPGEPEEDVFQAEIEILHQGLPDLTLTLDRSSIAENAGSVAVRATVRRNFVSDQPLGVLLQTAQSSDLLLPRAFSIPAGGAEASAFIGVVDNSLVEGDRSVGVVAWVLDPATGNPVKQSPPVALTILDDDQPALSLELGQTVFAEGLDPAALLTVGRNTPPDQPLEVSLFVDPNTEATLPQQVILPAGAADAQVDLVTLDDGVTDGTKTVLLRASAPGYQEATLEIQVTDIHLPDLVAEIGEVPASVYTEQDSRVSYRIENRGLVAAGGGFLQRVFLSNDPLLGGDTLLAQYSFPGDLPAGLYFERSEQVRYPLSPGTYWILVVTDAGNDVVEVDEENNISVSAMPVEVQTAYRATVQTDFEIGPAGEPVMLWGTAFDNRSGAPAPFVPVNIHLKVNGTRRILAALTDKDGHFERTFRPLPGEAGRYVIGAAHPGANEAPDQDTFTLFGMRSDPERLQLDVIQDGPPTSAGLMLVNLSEIPLTRLQVEAVDVPEQISLELELGDGAPAPTLVGDGELPLACSIESTGSQTGPASFSLRVSTAEGFLLEIPVDIERIRPEAVLSASPASLTAGMLRGEQTLVSFVLKNQGGAPTGPIEALLPQVSWMRLTNATPLPSLAPGAEVRLALQLLPPEDLELAEYTGNMVLRGTSGQVSIPFRIRALSDGIGDLQVETVDELTYYAVGSPPLAGAVITVRDDLDGTVVASGVTDAEGLFRAEGLAEGYYQIESAAENHSSDRRTILIHAGGTAEETVFLSRQTVQYIWQVVPTQIEDRTRIQIQTVFETNVPAPVITIDPPLVDLSEFDSATTQVDFTITNHGLIAAEDMRMVFSTHPDWRFEPLIDQIGTLPAKSSITIPVLFHQQDTGAGLRAGGGGCGADAHLVWKLICGKATVSYDTPISIRNAGGSSCSIHIGSWTAPPGGGGPGGASISGKKGKVTNSPCDPCMVSAVFDCLIGFTPFRCPYQLGQCYRLGGLGNCGRAALWCVGSLTPLSAGLNGVRCWWNFRKCKNAASGGGSGGGSGFGLTEADDDPFMSQLAQVLAAAGDEEYARVEQYGEYLVSIFDLLIAFTGDEAWFNEQIGPLYEEWWARFGAFTEEASADGIRISSPEMDELVNMPLPEGVGADQVLAFIARWNRTQDYYDAGVFSIGDVPEGESTDFIDADLMANLSDVVILAYDNAEAEGYSDPLEGFIEAKDDLFASISTGGGVCARVKLEIQQEAVITRDAFDASLELSNSGSAPLEQILVDLRVTDVVGQDVSALFGIRPPELRDLDAVDGTGTLAAGSTGKASWILIPGRDAAPEAPTQFLVSGTFSYVQNGLPVEIPLMPETITVLPSPVLLVDYFHQRDVFSDDPFTDPIEPSEPFALGVLVRNVGYGTARNMHITSAQPKIIENEKGLLIDFKIIGTQVNGQEFDPSLTAVLGDIEPGGLALGNWLLTSSLQGLFTEYDASFEHVDALGEARLSLIDDVSIHEMIRMVEVGPPFDDGLPDFLVNDDSDLLDLPDTLYLSDGSVVPVSAVVDVAAEDVPTEDDLEVDIQVDLPDGWVYLRMDDPADGAFRLAGIQRSDGSMLAIGKQVWTTDRTFLGLGQQPVYENRIHLVDFNSPGTYTLIYALPNPLDVTPPTSSVVSLPASSTALIPVSWEGADDDSGVAVFDIYVSTDGGPFEPWLTGTSERGGLFEGELGSSYAFYSRARDLAGNLEDAPAEPDTSTSVDRTNSAPVLEAIENQVIGEGQTLALRLEASDVDLPGDQLSFALAPGAPAGIVLDPSSGRLTWITGEGMGGRDYLVTVIVTDNGTPPLSDSQEFTVHVQPENSAPQLKPPGVLAVNELSELAFLVEAEDPDLPGQSLSYRLVPGAPAGAAIDPASGRFSWTPSEAQGPGNYAISVEVVDNGQPELSDSMEFIVEVREVNHPPVLNPLGPLSGQEWKVISARVTGVDPDIPAQSVWYRLGGDIPAGLALYPSTGLLWWKPQRWQGGKSYTVELIVTDTGQPALSGSRTLTLSVADTVSDFDVRLADRHLPVGISTPVPLMLATDVVLNDLVFDILLPGDIWAEVSVEPVGKGVESASLELIADGRYRCTVSSTGSGIAAGAVANLLLTPEPDALSQMMVARVLDPAAHFGVDGLQPLDGEGLPGTLWVLNEAAILILKRNQAGLTLEIHGPAGAEIEIQTAEELVPEADWQLLDTVVLPENGYSLELPLPDEPDWSRFFRGVIR